MELLEIEGVTHWSIPVDDLEISEEFYGDLLGLTPPGRLGNSVMSCFNVGGHNILLCQRQHPSQRGSDDEHGAHHSVTVTPEVFEKACGIFLERNVPVEHLPYRAKGFFTGRELYFFDPSGNRLELRGPEWQEGMPQPPFEELARRQRSS